jgi:hypothetical protein
MNRSLSKYCFWVLLLVWISGRSQGTDSTDTGLKPTLGLGTGVFSYYGETSEGKGFQNPMLSRIGYDLSIGQDLTHYLNLRFYTIFGKLSSAGTGEFKHDNFESSIRAGGVNLTYNFGNLLKPTRHISPYLLIGIESFEFLSKTDLYDDKGNRYHYWSDGSIRNIDENSPDADKAIFIKRDYKYESDIRELNQDGFGKYAERSFAVPIGAGFIFHLSDRMDFKIGTTLHITKTDLIDGRTVQSIGKRAGNKENDRFLMSSVAIHYNLTPKESKAKESKEEFTEEELLALDKGDEDNDAVNDYKDRSPFTPAGVTVDTSGVPEDADADRVADYQDKELGSAAGAIVTTEGVTLTDSLAEAIYLAYMDSTGAYGKRVVLDAETPAGRDVYVVKVGEFRSGVPPETINVFLSIPDISSATTPDSLTVYTAGRYYSYQEAEKRRAQLQAQGLGDVSVVLYKNNKFTKVDGPVNGDQEAKVIAENKSKESSEVKENKGELGVIIKPGEVDIKNKETNPTENAGSETSASNAPKVKGTVYRVQVGAYKRKLSKQVFSGLPDMVTVTAPNGVTKYLSGTFTDYNEAAKHRVDLLVKGYSGAFIVAFKDGDRVQLDETGVKYVETKTPEEEKVEKSDNEQHAIDKNLVSFKIQVGIFKNDVPADIMGKFAKIQGIEAERTREGLQRYTVGPFKTYQEAAKRKAELMKEFNFQGAFIVAYFKEKMIDVQEAIELTK